MADDLLSAATAALRETPTEGDAAATRLRVRRTLEADHRAGRQLASFLTVTSILLAGTMSWAFATGRAGAVWRAVVDPAPVRAVGQAAEAVEARGAVVAVAPVAAVAVAVAPVTPVVPVVPAPVAVAPAVVAPAPVTPAPVLVAAPSAPPRAPAIAARAPAEPSPSREAAPMSPAAASLETIQSGGEIEVLYRSAHELHFHGGDHAAAIAAWDAYLAAEPTGRFVAEARYNRALLLIRVGRLAEARAALEPYARGEVAGGYRQAEAAQLVGRLPGAAAR